jgi:hypothetical protein
MTESDNDISLYLQPRFGDPPTSSSPLVIRLIVGLDIVWDMLPYPTTTRSRVTLIAYRDYCARMGLDPQVTRSVLLDNHSIGVQALPALRIVPSHAPDRIGVDGFLGFDFFSQSQVVEWHPNTGFMRLRHP